MVFILLDTIFFHLTNPAKTICARIHQCRFLKKTHDFSYPEKRAVNQSVARNEGKKAITLGTLTFRAVQHRDDSLLYNEFIHRYHYLGYKPLTGAQKRYMVFAGKQLLALLGFGASAWQIADRDRFIGWSHEQRKRNLQLVVNNARHLILPWVKCHNLASHILSLAAKRLPDDWQQQYGYRPVLLETFVHKDRFKGTCYRAANWIHVGQTTGRGKLGGKQPQLPVKHVFLYPLTRKFRNILAEGSYPYLDGFTESLP